MCGRYSITTAPEAIRRMFDIPGPLPNLRPRYNAAPTQDLPVVRQRDEGGHEVAMLRWGLVPHWSDGPDSRYSMINARAETVERSPAYKYAFKRRRCLVPADGFYEWQKQESGPKQPYRITMKDGKPFAMAGLWEHWSEGDDVIESFTIIVTDANKTLKPIHDRMPVILEPAMYGAWLSGEAGKELLVPCRDELMTAYPVSRHVNSPEHDDPDCLEPKAA